MNRGTMFAIGFLVIVPVLVIVAGIACYFGACAG
jgi:hypothetical protein